MFLRQQMDSEGWLPAALIASFRRMQTLSTDISTIVQAVSDSDVVEVKDGVKVRKKDDPVSFPKSFLPPAKTYHRNSIFHTQVVL